MTDIPKPLILDKPKPLILDKPKPLILLQGLDDLDDPPKPPSPERNAVPFKFKRRKKRGIKKARTGSTAKDQNKQKRKLIEMNEAEADDEMEEEGEKASHYSKRRKRRKKGLVFAAMNRRAKNAASEAAQGTSVNSTMQAGSHAGADQGATVHMPKMRDVNIEQGKVLNDKGQEVYKGMDSYHTTNKGGTTKTKRKYEGQGPARPTMQNIKINCRFDYQPDVCKDYKETGYCGYGDSCKFLHDRGDYKMGWQIEAEWQQKQARIEARKRGEIVSDSESDYEIKDEESDELPFACHICRDSFTKPVVTRCKHYFCQKCIVDAFLDTPACPVCGYVLDGSFVRAEKIMDRLSRRLAFDKADKEAEAAKHDV